MANFEGLIRGALSAKGATSAAERGVVYQSSRNALQRLIAENRSITVENAVSEQQALETAIARIEAEYAAPVTSSVAPSPTQPAQTADASPQVQPAAKPAEKAVAQDPSRTDPLYEVQQILGDVAPRETTPAPRAPVPQPIKPPAAPEQVTPQAVDTPVPQPQATPHVADTSTPQTSHPEPVAPAPLPPEPDAPNQTFNETDYDQPYVDEPVVVPSGFKRRRKSQALLWTVFFIVLVAVLAWIGYRLALGVVDGSLFGYQSNGNSAVSRDVGQTDAQSDYITILEPGDLTAMVVSDRGRVEIINEQSLEMIRILSLRDKSDRAQSAKPILIKLKPGVLEQIAGKRVTAEIYARSGSSSAAQFAVECEFGEGVGCGRKRFHVGVQPEASIFAFTMDENRSVTRDAFIAINTDITDNAEITGEGDVLDIVYIRLRTSKE